MIVHHDDNALYHISRIGIGGTHLVAVAVSGSTWTVTIERRSDGAIAEGTSNNTINDAMRRALEDARKYGLDDYQPIKDALRDMLGYEETQP